MPGGTGNLSQQFSQAPPLPSGGEQMQAPMSDPRLDPNNQPQQPGVNFASKTGNAAFLADKVLSGWLAGTKIANERKHQKMVDEVSGAKTGLDLIGQSYRAAVESGDEKKIKEASGALSEAWNDYLNKAEKYSIPEGKMGKDGKPKGPGVKERLKEGFMGGAPPNLGIAHTTLDMLRKTDPRSMFDPSKAEQQQSKLTEMQLTTGELTLKDQQAKDAAMKNYADALKKPAAQRTAEDNQTIDFTESYYFGKTDEQKSRDKILNKISNGGQLSDPERQLAEGYGMIKPKVTQTLINQTVDPKGRPVNQLISVGPDGQVVGKADLGRSYVPPDQAQIATEMINGQVSALTKLAKKAHPDWDDQTLYKFALASVAPNSGGSGDWFMKNQQADVMNRAIGAVLKQHSSKHRDPSGQEVQSYDQIGDTAQQALVSAGDDGRYYYVSQLGIKPETHSGFLGFGSGPDTYMGMTPEQAAKEETQFLAELRSELRKQNPKLPDTDIDQMMPKPVFGKGMQAPPQGQQGGPMKSPPNQSNDQPNSQPMYSVALSNGQTVNRRMSKEQADALKTQGLRVVLMGGGPDQIP